MHDEGGDTKYHVACIVDDLSTARRDRLRSTYGISLRKRFIHIVEALADYEIPERQIPPPREIVCIYPPAIRSSMSFYEILIHIGAIVVLLMLLL